MDWVCNITKVNNTRKIEKNIQKTKTKTISIQFVFMLFENLYIKSLTLFAIFSQYLSTYSVIYLCTIQGGPKKQSVFESWYFETVNGRKASDMSTVAEFCLQKVWNLHVNTFKYSLHSLHKSLLYMKLCWIWQKCMDFTQCLTWIRNESNINNHLHTECFYTKFNMGTLHRDSYHQSFWQLIDRSVQWVWLS